MKDNHSPIRLIEIETWIHLDNEVTGMEPSEMITSENILLSLFQ